MCATRSDSSPQQRWLLPAEPETRRGPVAQVVLDAKGSGTARPFAVPRALQASVAPGVLVEVPGSKRGPLDRGLCVAVTVDRWDQTTPPISAVVHPRPLLPASLLELSRWLAHYYAASDRQALAAILPLTLREPPAPTLAKFVWRRHLPRDASTPSLKGAKQRALLHEISFRPRRLSDCLSAAEASQATLKALQQRELVQVVSRPIVPDAPGAPDDDLASRNAAAREADHELTEDQRAVWEQIAPTTSPPSFAPFLVFGVPGSGKTEVYIRAMRAAIASGCQAIFVIPEVALVTQLVERIARRFERVAVLHGQLTPKQRLKALDQIARGEVDVIVGTRTAVFAPCKQLGVIIVDEEQEPSFKNLTTPRFHARDVAVKRAHLENVPVILGSATPSLESWFNAREGRYRLLELPRRVSGALTPTVQFAPVVARPGSSIQPGEPGHAAATAKTDGHLIGKTLRDALRQTLDSGSQALVLHNRRGFAAWLQCQRCGLVVRCARCDRSATLHRGPGESRLRCHACGWSAPATTRCANQACGGRLQAMTRAIQDLEHELASALPDARVLRLDADTMRHRRDYTAALEAFAAGEADVMIGTQMIAKGLDFPRVRLVGVIDIDAAFQQPDFRATERIFQLMTQVVGRGGRREGTSRAIVQTDYPHDDTLVDAAALDFLRFAQRTLAERRSFDLPPYTRLARLVFSDQALERVISTSTEVATQLRTVAGRLDAKLRVGEPEPCPIARQRDRYRYQILLTAHRDARIQTVIEQAGGLQRLRRGVERLAIDIDPLDFS